MLSQKVLLLNQNYEPLTLCRVRRALVLLYLRKAEMVEPYDSLVARSANVTIPIPSVLRLNYYVKVTRREIPLTKRNIMRRDNNQCQYCGKTSGPMTTDHVIPKVLGGTDSWENLVCACVECNTKKGNLPLHKSGLKLLRKPKKPHFFTFILNSLGQIPAPWRQYLFLS
ncbi:MAG: HNH endonuclease [candidate division WOR-3 bacterium]